MQHRINMKSSLEVWLFIQNVIKCDSVDKTKWIIGRNLILTCATRKLNLGQDTPHTTCKLMRIMMYINECLCWINLVVDPHPRPHPLPNRIMRYNFYANYEPQYLGYWLPLANGNYKKTPLSRAFLGTLPETTPQNATFPEKTGTHRRPPSREGGGG